MLLSRGSLLDMSQIKYCQTRAMLEKKMCIVGRERDYLDGGGKGVYVVDLVRTAVAWQAWGRSHPGPQNTTGDADANCDLHMQG